ncbi:MAG: LytTR family DNA-binding domain-containing protein [Bacteroidota bacterium]
MNCLIVDDEPLALSVMEAHLKEFKDLKVIGKCRSAVQAFELIEKHQIDLLFLDIEMPKLDGFSFLKSLKNPPLVVVTTAHRDYAIQGFELDVVDYLLKPISLKRMMQAISKARRMQNETKQDTNTVAQETTTANPFIFIRSERENVKVELDSILYVESLKNHVKVVTPSKSYITLVSMSQMETKLPGSSFLRVHRSFLINKSKITQYTHTYLTLDRKSIPIGKIYRDKVVEELEKNQI